MSLRVTQVLLGLSLLLNAFVLAGYAYYSWFEPHRPPMARLLPRSAVRGSSSR